MSRKQTREEKYQYHKKWSLKNAERLKKYRKKYYIENKEKIKEYRKSEKVKKYNKDYHNKNKDDLLKKMREKYWQDPIKSRQRVKDYYLKNKDHIRKNEKKKVQKLDDRYVKEKLKRNGYKLKDITPELIQVKRSLLKINRFIKQGKI